MDFAHVREKLFTVNTIFELLDSIASNGYLKIAGLYMEYNYNIHINN